ncbi:MAG: OmpW family protein, partial [Mesorhizobium sp.]
MATKRMNVLRGVTAAVILLLVGQQAVAADLPEIPYDPQEAASVEWPSPWQIRLRALGVITEDSGYVNAVPGSGLSYSNTVTPELDISYFFTDNVAAELILGTTYANITGQGSIGALRNIGKVWLLPPTLTLQYHFT